MTCKEFADFLDAYIAGALPSERRALFDKHLAVCPDCQKYWKSYLRTIELGRTAFASPNDPVPADVPEELIQAVLEARKREN